MVAERDGLELSMDARPALLQDVEGRGTSGEVRDTRSMAAVSVTFISA